MNHHGGICLLDKVWDDDAQLLQILEDNTPDVLLMDCQFQGGRMDSLLQRIQAASQGTKTMLLYDCFGDCEVIKALVHGAKGCVRKTLPPAQWIKAIQVIHGGDIWVDRKLLVDALDGLLQQVPLKWKHLESKPETADAEGMGSHSLGRGRHDQ